MTTTKKTYSAKMIVCRNGEAIDAMMSDDARSAYIEEMEGFVANKCSFCADYEHDSFFHNWTGGKYGSQAKFFGWERLAPGLLAKAIETTTTTDEDYGDEDSDRVITWSELPAEVRSAWEAEIGKAYKLWKQAADDADAN